MQINHLFDYAWIIVTFSIVMVLAGFIQFFIGFYIRQKKKYILNQVRSEGPCVEAQVNSTILMRSFLGERFVVTKAYVIMTRKSIFYFIYRPRLGLYTIAGFMQLYVNKEPLPKQLIKHRFIPIDFIRYHKEQAIIKFSYQWQDVEITFKNIKAPKAPQISQQTQPLSSPAHVFDQAPQRVAHEEKKEKRAQTEQTEQIAGLWRRLVAYFIDLLILSIIAIIYQFIVIFISYSFFSEADYIQLFFVLSTPFNFFISYILAAFYFIPFWAIKGQTIGKMAMRIKLVSTRKKAFSWDQAIGRYIGYLITWHLCGLPFIWIAIDDKKQGFHDKIARTVVVRKKK